MQINLQDSGTYLFISDHCHVIENVGFWLNEGFDDQRLMLFTVA